MERVFKNARNILFDCDGVLWRSETPINGAQNVISRLLKVGKRVFLVTNNSTKTREEYAQKCANLGFPVTKDHIICTANVMAVTLKNKGITGPVYLLGGNAIKQELDFVGIESIGSGPDNTRIEDFSSIKIDDRVQAVVVGFDKYFNFIKIVKACLYINRRLPFYATNTDAQAPTVLGLTAGTGAIVQAIATGSQTQPEIIGKPSKYIIDFMHSQLSDFDEKESIFVGDKLNTDILFGNSYGLKTLLVMTGVTNEEDLAKAEGLMKPTFVLSSVEDIIPLLE
ncbi:hypothetical protein Ciccas_001387 [Cichlidogyrus casuarinus]|uniref:Phosphoglycolate phosphatase n=1 Tax=Cichlidogyrus casuarinus TaxID=1844966 RepID=A0ABD2QMH4_9PLAT